MGSRWQMWMERLPIAADRPAFGYLFAVFAVSLSVAVRFIFSHMLPAGYPFLTFFPSVILTAFLFGVGPGIVSGVLALVAARYFFMAPLFSFALESEHGGALAFFALVIFIDLAIIAMLQRTNAELRAQRARSEVRTEQREVMFQELQHRISNKLQLIASLLHLQRRDLADAAARRALEDAARRVGLVGRISRALHDPDHEGLGVGAFLDQVGRDIIESAGATHVDLAVDAEPGLELAPDAGVPVALILCETISNALEHGLAGRERGSIRITVLRPEQGHMLFTVVDDGHGVPDGFDAATASSLGLRIATSLARQLNGSYRLGRGAQGGTVAELRVRA